MAMQLTEVEGIPRHRKELARQTILNSMRDLLMKVAPKITTQCSVEAQEVAADNSMIKDPLAEQEDTMIKGAPKGITPEAKSTRSVSSMAEF